MATVINIKDETTTEALKSVIKMYTHWLSEANLSVDEINETQGHIEELEGIMNQLSSECKEHSCTYCGKTLEGGQDCRYIEDTGEIFCYEEIKSKDDIENTCIGRDLLKCGYSLDYIWFLFDENSEYAKTLTEEGTTRDMRDKKGEPYPEIFYTTVEE
jgi:hypothetical protein